MWPRKHEVSFISFLIVVSIFFIQIHLYIPAGILAFVAIVVLIDKEYYLWAGVASIFIAVTFYGFYLYELTATSFLSILVIFVMVMAGGDFHKYLVKRDFKKVLERMNISYKSVEILSDKVGTYYKNRYQFQRPYAVKVVTSDTVLKGYFDAKRDVFIIKNPQSLPVHNDTTNVWRNVIHIHTNGNPQRIEYTDREDNCVGVDVLTENGSYTGGSWRLRKGVREYWNPEAKMWGPKPKKTVPQPKKIRSQPKKTWIDDWING